MSDATRECLDESFNCLGDALFDIEQARRNARADRDIQSRIASLAEAITAVRKELATRLEQGCAPKG